LRIWSIHPKYLDWKGLGAQWRETLLAQAVLMGNTKGWKNHPQIDRFKHHPQPVNAIGNFLVGVFNEATCRGYNYNFNKIIKPVEVVESIDITEGQLIYEFKILMDRLEKRDPEKFLQNLETGNNIPECHPIFNIISGLPADWEKSYWRTKKRWSI
jgi:hypothetical protein